MRIIAGRFKGFSLSVPKSGTRPTTDRVREAIFSHLDGENILDNATVLDLYGGTGALAIEALSRGARSALVVDRSATAVSLLKKSAAALKKLTAWQASGVHLRIRRGQATVVLRSMPADSHFSLVFLDPPYNMSDADFDTVLELVAHSPAVTEQNQRAVIVAERSVRSVPPQTPHGWELTQTRDYGETRVIYFSHEIED